jgi:hypothetical protein
MHKRSPSMVFWPPDRPARYLEENPLAGVIIVPDADERAAWDEFNRTVTAVLGGIGLVFAGLTAWRIRRR